MRPNFVIFLFVFLIFSSLAVVSCTSRKPTQPMVTENTKTIQKIIRDTVYEVKADSSYYQAYIDCANGNPILVENFNDFQKKKSEVLQKPKSQQGKYLKPPKIDLKDGLLTVNCEAEAQQLFKQWKETYIKENLSTKTPIYIESPLKWYQKILMWIGGVFLLLSAIGIVLKIKS